MIERVKEILDKRYSRYKELLAHQYGTAEEICQLFEQKIQVLKDERDDWKATAEVACNPELSKILLEPKICQGCPMINMNCLKCDKVGLKYSNENT